MPILDASALDEPAEVLAMNRAVLASNRRIYASTGSCLSAESAQTGAVSALWRCLPLRRAPPQRLARRSATASIVRMGWLLPARSTLPSGLTLTRREATFLRADGMASLRAAGDRGHDAR